MQLSGEWNVRLERRALQGSPNGLSAKDAHLKLTTMGVG